MEITTSAGKTYAVEYCDARGARCVLQISDMQRKLSRVAAEFEGLEWLETDSGKRFDGYGELNTIQRIRGGIHIVLIREEVSNGAV